MQLAALDTADVIDDMDIPGFRLHALKGSDKGRWSIWVNGNWRVTFEFENGNAMILDYGTITDGYAQSATSWGIYSGGIPCSARYEWA